MTERPIEVRLRAWYRDEVGPREVAPATLVASVDLIATVEPRRSSADRRFVTLLLAAALLVALVVGTALAVGAGIIRLPWVPEPLPVPVFGTASDYDCGEVYEDGRVLNLLDPGGPADAGREVRLYDDGRLLTVTPWYPSIEATFAERRLSDEGVDLLLAEAVDAGLTPGCRTMYADADDRRLWVRGPDEDVFVMWGREAASSIRAASAGELAMLDALADRLAKPEVWLPAQAFVDARARTVVPERWRVHIQIMESGMEPGDTLTTADGLEFVGENPDFPAFVLPSGGPPESFGVAAGPEGEVELHRCADVTAAEAAALVAAMTRARASHVPNDVWEVFSADLAKSYMVQIMAVLGDDDCASVVASMEYSPPPEPTPGSDEDLAGLDPCSLVPEGSAGGVQRDLRSEPSTLPFDGVSQACSIPIGDGYSSIALTLRSRSTAVEEAEWWAMAIFGEDAQEEVIAGAVAWTNSCGSAARMCTPALAVSIDPYLIVLTASSYPPGEVEMADLRILATEVLADLNARAPGT